ncbi:hypothetical protein ACYSNR_02005 [Enterococcus sp. LJL128]
MGRKKKEEQEVIESVDNEIKVPEVIEPAINENDEAAAPESLEAATSDDLSEGVENVTTYIRRTPFGTEVWDPKTKSTIMQPNE